MDRHTSSIEAVVAHLRHLLNARRGQSPSCPDYGLDGVGLAPQDGHTRGALREHIEGAIRCFEPRLSHVRVHQRPQRSMPDLRFRVCARLGRDPVELDVGVGSPGNVTVEGLG